MILPDGPKNKIKASDFYTSFLAFLFGDARGNLTKKPTRLGWSGRECQTFTFYLFIIILFTDKKPVLFHANLDDSCFP